MNEIQSELLSMYKELKRVFDEHGIRYYGGYGTAIGALRHKGFIPWDDDMDILIWAEDLPQITTVIKEELNSDQYYFHITTADWHPHLIKKNNNFEQSLKDKNAIFIDLFPITKHPNGMFRGLISKMMYVMEHLSIFIINKITIVSIHRVLKWIPAACGKISQMVVEKDSNNTVVLNVISHNDYFAKDCYEKGDIVQFEDTVIPLPRDIDMMLKTQYGDYMTPPSVDQRRGANDFPCSAFQDYIEEQKKC